MLHDRRPYFVIDMLNRVLVVDDEPRVAAMLNDVLKTLGYALDLRIRAPTRSEPCQRSGHRWCCSTSVYPASRVNSSSTVFTCPIPTCRSS